MLKKIFFFFQSDLLFSISFFLALVASSFGRFDVHFIDFQVILTLFGLMLTINGLEKAGLLNFIGQRLLSKSHSLRALIRTIVLLSFFSSMVLTNDVAILTLLPMYLLITKGIQEQKSVLLGAVYLIVAANLGSSLFPFGNPQNLFLFSFYNLPLTTFLQTTGMMVVLSLTLLVGSIQLLPASPLIIKKTTHFLRKIHGTLSWFNGTDDFGNLSCRSFRPLGIDRSIRGLFFSKRALSFSGLPSLSHIRLFLCDYRKYQRTRQVD